MKAAKQAGVHFVFPNPVYLLYVPAGLCTGRVLPIDDNVFITCTGWVLPIDDNVDGRLGRVRLSSVSLCFNLLLFLLLFSLLLLLPVERVPFKHILI